MVGPPKLLTDLRRIEGALRVTCRSCGASRMVDREETIRIRMAHRQSLDWLQVIADQRCFVAGCNSADVKVEGVPFGENSAELRRHRDAMLLMNLALRVLKAAAPQSSDVPAEAVRLALRVLHPFVGDQEMLVAYWRHVTEADGTPWSSGHLPLRWIVTRLIDRGYPVIAELR